MMLSSGMEQSEALADREWPAQVKIGRVGPSRVGNLWTSDTYCFILE